MNPLAQKFRACAFQAGQALGFGNGKLIRQFGLGDFLDNGIRADDSGETIAVNAIVHFCEDEGWGTDSFRFGMLVACAFLGEISNKGWTPQVVDDLGTLLYKLDQSGKEWNIAIIERWINSNF